MNSFGRRLPFSLLAVLLCASPLVCPAQNFVNFEGKQVSPVRVSPDGTRLFAVNTPDARLSVFDIANPNNPILIAEIPVGIEPVSVNPRNSDEAWVVNEVSDSISIVSVSRRIVVDTIYVQDEPGDVAFADGKAFVTCGRRNQVRAFDVITRLPVGGPISPTVSFRRSRRNVSFSTPPPGVSPRERPRRYEPKPWGASLRTCCGPACGPGPPRRPKCRG